MSKNYIADKETLDEVNSKIGTASDGEAEETVLGRLKRTILAVGNANDVGADETKGSMFGKVNSVISLLRDGSIGLFALKQSMTDIPSVVIGAMSGLKGKYAYISDGTFTVPEGVTSIDVYACAAGGVIYAGEYVIGKRIKVTPGEKIAITCGVDKNTVIGKYITLNKAVVQENLRITIDAIDPRVTLGIGGEDGSSSSGDYGQHGYVNYEGGEGGTRGKGGYGGAFGFGGGGAGSGGGGGAGGARNGNYPGNGGDGGGSTGGKSFGTSFSFVADNITVPFKAGGAGGVSVSGGKAGEVTRVNTDFTTEDGKNGPNGTTGSAGGASGGAGGKGGAGGAASYLGSGGGGGAGGAGAGGAGGYGAGGGGASGSGHDGTRGQDGYFGKGGTGGAAGKGTGGLVILIWGQ